MKYADTRILLANAVARPNLSLGEDRLHYLHVPKCGGTTLRYVLESFAQTKGLSCVNEARDGRPFEVGRISMGHERPNDVFQRSDTQYITVLRDPAARLRSFVQMIEDKLNRAPAEVVDGLTWRQANYAVYLLGGESADPTASTDAAKRALEQHVTLFGFQERLTEFLRLLCGMCGIGGLLTPSFQTTPTERRLGSEFDERFHELTAADRALYAFALDLYEERFAGPDLEVGNDRPSAGQPYLRIALDADTVTASELYLKE